MTEMEWLKQQSGLTDDELKAYETLMGDAKFKVMLTKMQATAESAAADKAAAETERLNLERQYNEVYLPEMRKVTQDALSATGEAARLKAQLDQAREYGIVPNAPPADPTAPTRAPGSPDPSMFVTRDDYTRTRNDLGMLSVQMNDLNAKHFKLFGAPIDDMQGILAEVQREQTLGHPANVEQVWERKYNVAAKRAEITAAEQKKHDDSVASDAIKKFKQENPATGGPHTRRPGPSRFSTYDRNDSASGNVKPWQAPSGLKKAANKPLHDWAVSKVAEASR